MTKVTFVFDFSATSFFKSLIQVTSWYFLCCAGAIVGIVLAALVIGAALLVVVVILAIYCYKTQPLGIDEEEDEEHLTLNLKKNLLFDVDAKLRKEKKV